MSVLTLADVKRHLNITDTANDTEIQDFIDAAEAAIARAVGPLEVTEFTETVRGSRVMLEVTKLPAVDLVSVTPRGGSALDVTTLHLDEAGTIEHVSGYARFAAVMYDVVYEAGHATPLNGAIDLAVKEMVRHLWATQRGPSRRPGSSEANLSNTIPGAAYAWPIRVQQLLNPYIPLGSA